MRLSRQDLFFAFIAHSTLVCVAACTGTAATSVDGGVPDAGDHWAVGPISYTVGGSFQPDVEVKVNGITVDPNDFAPGDPIYFLSVEYTNYGEALSAAPSQMETWKNGVRLDQIEIKFGACADWCRTFEYLGCADRAVISESASTAIGLDGSFLGASSSPEQWRGSGCLRCTFDHGSDWVICS